MLFYSPYQIPVYSSKPKLALPDALSRSLDTVTPLLVIPWVMGDLRLMLFLIFFFFLSLSMSAQRGPKGKGLHLLHHFISKSRLVPGT